MYQNKKAFTLIELLVVVLIIGILSAIALPQYRVAVAKSRLMQSLVLARAVYEAEEVYYLANGTYTTDLANLDIGVSAYITGASSSTDISTNYLPNGYVVQIVINFYGSAEDRVEVYTTSTKQNGITYYFDHPTQTHPVARKGAAWCEGTDEVYQQACLSMGGVFDSNTSIGGKFYRLP